MKNSSFQLSILTTALLIIAGPAFADNHAPMWSDVMVQLHGAGKAFLVDTKSDAVVASLDTCKAARWAR